jgi:hypothetical protein
LDINEQLRAIQYLLIEKKTSPFAISSSYFRSKHLKKILTLAILVSSFISHGQRTMFGSQNNYVAPVIPFQAPSINTNGLVLHLDAANPASYSGTGTTWTDLSSFGNNGTLVDGPTYDYSNGGSIVFDGLNDYVSTNLLLNSIANVTLHGWVYIANTSLRGPFIRVGSGANGYAIGIGSGTFDQAGNQMIALFPYVRWINTNTNYGTGWKFFTFTLSATSVPKFYINGQLLIGSFSGSNPSTPSSGVYLAKNIGDLGGGFRIFAGKIAQVSVYNKELSATEILEFFNSTKSLYGL